MYNYWKDTTDMGFPEPLWSIMINMHENDEARNDAHITSTSVQLYQRTSRFATPRNKTGN